jgi:hypothetical protein
MEVHHHPHPEKKNFKEYFFEGIMIFLAVTLGFIAENIREHARAKELAETLYQEVYSDSVQLQKINTNRERKEKAITDFIRFVKDSSVTKPDQKFLRDFTWSLLIVSPIIFEPADGILNQLKNSGSLRYFKSSLLQKEFGELSVIIAKIRTRMEVEGTYSQQFGRPFIIKFYNFNWYDELTKNGAVPVIDAIVNAPDLKETPLIANASLFNKTEAINMISYYQLILRGTRQVQFKAYMDINHTLLETLRKEYTIREK